MDPSMFNPGDTRIAFQAKSDRALRRSVFLFQLLQKSRLVNLGKQLTRSALKAGFPIGFVLKPLVFKQFCGGETLEQCLSVIENLQRYQVKAIPDFSVEGKVSGAAFDRVKKEVLRTIKLAAGHSGISFAVFKPTGIASFGLWEKLANGTELKGEDAVSEQKLKGRLDEIFEMAAIHKVPVFVDAEETWIQPAVDQMVRTYSERFNRDGPLVYNTVQMYRKDRLAFMETEMYRAERRGYYLGYKIVRGAYHEQEKSRAQKMGDPSPVFLHKDETDEAYNTAVTYCFEHRERISFCAATHNDNSTLLAARLLADHNLINDKRFSFAQLYGMSDHLTFNLAAAGFYTAKYLPYGPLKEVIPYLFRRAEENRTVEGETGRELFYLRKELLRRKYR